MAKDIDKILKTIKHFGQGTFDEIDDIIKNEKSVVSTIDKDLLGDITSGEEGSLDFDLESILGEDLQSISVPQEAEQVKKQEELPEIEKLKETEKAEVPFEELDLGIIPGLEEEKVEEEAAPETLVESKVKEKKEKTEAKISAKEKKARKKEKIEEEREEKKVEEGYEDLQGLEELEQTISEQPVTEKEEIEISPFEGLEKSAEGVEESFEDLTSYEQMQPEGEKSLEETEQGELPEEFIDLSLAAEGIPSEQEEEFKPVVDYSGLDISEEDIHIIINTLKNYPAWLANEIKNLILNDSLSTSELSALVDMLSNNVHWKAVMEYLKDSLNIDLTYHLTPEEKVYIPSATEKALPYIKWGSIILVFSIVFLVVLFQFFIIPNQALHYYQSAYNILEKQNNLEEAMSNFNRASEMRKFEKWYLKFGRLLLERNFFENAMQIAERGKMNWPDNFSFYELISDVYFKQGGEKNIAESFRILEDLLGDRKFARDPLVYEAIAQRYESLGQYQEAIKIYSEGLRFFQPDFKYLMKMLQNFIILRNEEAAKDVFEKARKRFKKSVDESVFTSYANFLLEINKPFESKDVIDAVLKYNSHYAPIYLPYAHYFEKMNQPEVALKGLLIAEDIINHGLYKDDKTNVFDDILNEIGELYYAKQDDTQAYIYFERAVEQNPSNGRAYFNIGQLNYFYYNNYKLALDSFLKAQSLGFSNDYQDYMIGWINYQFKNYEQALFSFIKLEVSHLNNIDLKLAIGNSHIKAGKPELAIGYLSNFVSHWEQVEQTLRGREPNNPKRKEALTKLAVGYNNLGVAYAMLAKEKRNSSYESEALRLFIRSQEVYNFLFPGRVSNAESYINSMYILHPDVKRELLLMDSDKYFPKKIFD